MIRPEAFGENFVEQGFGIVLIHLDFFEDHLSFLLHIARIEPWAKNEIGDDVKGDGQVLVEHFGVEAGEFLSGERIEHAADGVHRTGNLFGGAALRALEDHVLEEMGDAVLRGVLPARARANPDAHGDRTHMGHRLGQDNQAVRQDVLLDVARVGGHSHILTHGSGDC